MSGFHLGPVGNMQAIHMPIRGLAAPRSTPGGIHVSLGGRQTRDRVGVSRRAWRLSWTRLTATEFAVLSGLHQGVYGPGPLALVDPSVSNLLTANQASAGAVSGDTSGWTSHLSPAVVAGGTLGRCIEVTADSLADPETLLLATDGLLPVLPDETYTAVFSCSLAAGDPLSVVAGLSWLDVAGTELSAEAGGTVALSGTAADVAVTGIAPSGAASMRLTLTPTTVPTTSSTVRVHTALARAGTDTTWTPGEGPMLVAFDSFDVSLPLLGLHDVSATLVQVG